MEYMNLLQKDIFEANVYVMSPKGRVIALPTVRHQLILRIESIRKSVIRWSVQPLTVFWYLLNTVLKTGDVVFDPYQQSVKRTKRGLAEGRKIDACS